MVAGAAVLITAFPAAAAAACPGCYGFERVEGRTYIDRTALVDQRADARERRAAQTVMRLLEQR